MEIRREGGSSHGVRADLLAVPFRAGGENGAELVALDRASGGYLLRECHQRSADPSKRGAVHVYQSHGQVPADLIALVGVGAPEKDGDLSVDAWRRFAGQAVEIAQRARAAHLAVSVASAPRGRDGAATLATGAVVEGALLGAYRVRGYKSNDSEPELALCMVVGAPASRAASQAETRAKHVAEATCFARDLTNAPAAVVTPAYLGQVAQRMGRELGLEVHVSGVRELRRLRMGAILGVGAGSENEPRLLELIYRPRAGGRRAEGRPHVALVGKGITFDSGGLSLKPAQSMEIQKRDMAGAAAVLGAMRALARLEPSIEVRGYVASAENMPSGSAYRPGDVLRTFSGKTVEVLNTDAEGRLVLADALAYATRDPGMRPRWVVDVATLTGAIGVALGKGLAGVMGSDRLLVEELIVAGREAGEPLWELPLVDEYVPAMESLLADLKNTGDGSAGAIFGGLFLREFVGGVPWAHLDIASVAWSDKARPCVPRGAVGWGVRTLVGLVERAAKRSWPARPAPSKPVGKRVRRGSARP